MTRTRAKTNMRLRYSLAAALVLAAGCDEPNNGPPTVSISVVEGPLMVGEVGTQLPSRLVLEYRDASDEPRRGVPIRVECAGYATGDPPCLMLREVGDTSAVAFRVQQDLRTDSRGRVAIEGKFGGIAGVGWWRFIDEVNGFVDSTSFAAFAGPPVRATLAPNDTAVRVGQTVRLRGHTYDGFGNRRNDVLSWEVIGAAAETVSPDLVRGLAYGRAKVRISFGMFRDSVMLSVVPAGTLAASWESEYSDGDDDIRIFDTDGANALPPIGQAVCVGKVTWSPAGDRLAYDRSPPGGGCFQPRLYTITPGGTATRVRADTGILHGESMPTWSGDGQFIHFVGRTGSQNGEIWRVPATGGLGERIGPVAGGFDEDWYPAGSPNGQEVVFGSLRDGALRLTMLTTATGAIRDLGIRAMAASWSRDGNSLAFSQRVLAVDGEDRFLYHVMNANGSGLVALPDTIGHMSSAPAWSPDGQWIAVVRDAPGGWGGTTLALVQVSTGLTLPLGWTRNMTSVSWKPVP